MRVHVLAPALAVWRHRQLLWMLLRREQVARTAGTLLGGSWLFLQPALQIAGLWFFLDVVLRVRSPSAVPFTEYFLVGMVAWLLIQEVLQRSLVVLVEYAPLYQRTPFPLLLLPLLPLLFTGSIYGLVLVALGAFFSGWRGAVGGLVSALCLWFCLLPLGYLLAVLGLFVRELRQLLPFVLTLLMYLTPIMYMPEQVPAAIRPWLYVNPLADVLAVVHTAVQGMPLTPGQVWRPLLLTAVLWPAAWLVFRRAQPHMREAL